MFKMGQRSLARLADPRGQAMVEFTLVFPFMLLILFSLMFFSTWALASADITSAADQGALYWAENPGASAKSIESYTANASAWPPLSPSEVSLSSGSLPSCTGSSCPGGGDSGSSLLILQLNSGGLCLAILGTCSSPTSTPTIPSGIKVKVTVSFPAKNIYVLGPAYVTIINALEQIVSGSQGFHSPTSITASATYLTQ